MFFGASGSIAGGTMLTLPFIPCGHVVAHVEERLRVVADVGQQPLDRRRVGRREVDVAAPHPAPWPSPARACSSAAGCGSWTRHDVPAADELARVHLVVAPPRRPTAPRSRSCGRALERVVHELGRVEELLAAVDHLPLDVEADVAHQRHERVEDLRDAAAERGGARRARRACPSAARRARGFPRSARGRRCACSRRASWCRRRRAGARAESYRRAGRVKGRGSPWGGGQRALGQGHLDGALGLAARRTSSVTCVARLVEADGAVRSGRRPCCAVDRS